MVVIVRSGQHASGYPSGERPCTGVNWDVLSVVSEVDCVPHGGWKP